MAALAVLGGFVALGLGIHLPLFVTPVLLMIGFALGVADYFQRHNATGLMLNGILLLFVALTLLSIRNFALHDLF